MCVCLSVCSVCASVCVAGGGGAEYCVSLGGCEWVCTCTAGCVWRSEDIFAEASSTFKWVSGLELRSPWTAGDFMHLTGPMPL